MRVVYSPRAIADLIDIADYLKARSPSGAHAVQLRIERSVALLAESRVPGVLSSKDLKCASCHLAGTHTWFSTPSQARS